MADSAPRVPLTVRLAAADKDVFETAAGREGLEAGIAARLVMEAAVIRIRAGDNLFDVLRELRGNSPPRVASASGR